MSEKGYDLATLHRAIEWAGANGVDHELVELHTATGVAREAYVLVLRDALSAMTGTEGATRSLAKEFRTQIWSQLDRQKVGWDRASQSRKVYQKVARGNCEIGPTRVESELAALDVGATVQGNVSGLVISYDELPMATALRDALPEVFGEDASNLRAEVNYYGPPYGASPAEVKVMKMEKCGIPFHGDSERPDVIGIVVSTVPKELHHQAYRGEEPVGERVVLTLRSGDVYVMDEVACGHTWKSDKDRRLLHYRHAAGCKGGNKHTPSMATLLGEYNKYQTANRY